MTELTGLERGLNEAIYTTLPPFMLMLTSFSYTTVSDPEGYYTNLKPFTCCVSLNLVQLQT